MCDTKVRESNARFVKWSDGSWSLLIGNQVRGYHIRRFLVFKAGASTSHIVWCGCPRVHRYRFLSVLQVLDVVTSSIENEHHYMFSYSAKNNESESEAFFQAQVRMVDALVTLGVWQ